MRDFLLFSSILNLLASALLTIAVFVASERGGIRNRFLIFLFCITSWALFYFFWQTAEDEVSAYWYCVGLIVPSAFIPVSFYGLALGLADKKSFFFLGVGYFFAFISLLSAPFGGLVSEVAPKLGLPYWPVAGPFLSIVVGIYILYVILTAATLIRGSREHLGHRSSQMRFVLGSSAIGFCGGCTNFPLWYDIPIPPYGNVIVFVYLLLVGYGLYNQRFSGVSVDISKAFIFILLIGSCSLFYMLGMAAWASLVDHDLSSNEYWTRGITSFLVLSLLFWAIPKIRLWAEQSLELLFRKDRVSVVTSIERFCGGISNYSDANEIFDRTIEFLYGILKIRGSALYHRASFDTQYKLHSSRGLEQDDQPVDFALYGPLAQHLYDKPECLDPDQIYGDMSPALEECLIDLKNKFSLSLVIPIFASNTLYGFIFLFGRKSLDSYWSSEQLSVLSSLGTQIALNLQARELERKSNEVDKLVALGTMAAGLSHEIKNPLVSVQTLASMLSSNRSLDRIDDSFKQVLLRDVKRISNIVEGVATYSDNRRGNMEYVSLSKAIGFSLDIYKAVIVDLGIDLQVEYLWDGEIKANLDQLIQVFNNLIENSSQALKSTIDPCIRIEVKQIKSGLKQTWIEVSVSDNGPGIPEDIRGRIFDPFITSKDTGRREDKHGMGLGLAISKQIIENHDAAISVSESKWGGAKFIISFNVGG